MLACSAGVFWTCECTFFVLGCHLRFGKCGGLGQENISRGSRRYVEKMGQGGEGSMISQALLARRYFCPPPTSTSPLHQSSTGQASKMAASKTQFTISLKITPALQAGQMLMVCQGDVDVFI